MVDYGIELISGEDKVREAVRAFYESVAEGEHLTVHEAAKLSSVTSIEMHVYMADNSEIGMPEGKKDARKYLQRLEESV